MPIGRAKPSAKAVAAVMHEGNGFYYALPSTSFPDLDIKPVSPQLEISFWKLWVG